MEKPITSIMKQHPTRASGTTTLGTMAARSEPSEISTTSSTISTVSPRVQNTSSMDSAMYSLKSTARSMVSPVGNCFSMSGSSASTCLDTVSGLAPGVCSTARNMVVLPLYQVVIS